jgi:hypothetical protein
MQYGADITGYVRPDGFEPSLAVLCPECCHRPKWADEAAGGEALTPEGWESLDRFAARCEACGEPAHSWRVHSAETQAQAVARVLHDDGQTWTADDGRTWDDLTASARREERYTDSGVLAAVRYVFPDGSALLVAVGNAGWWDLEGSRPWVVAGAEGDGEIGSA